MTWQQVISRWDRGENTQKTIINKTQEKIPNQTIYI